MKTEETYLQELDEQTKKVMEAAFNFCKEIYNMDTIDFGEVTTDEEKQKAGALAFERDARKKRALGRILFECGNYLFL